MKAILVFIDGTICDGRGRHHLLETNEFNRPEWILRDHPVAGSVTCLNKLSKTYRIVYIGARPNTTHAATEEWLHNQGFPDGPIFLGRSQEERLALVKEFKDKYDFIAGIGDRWDDNELHLEIGCLSIILKEYEGDWEKVPGRIEKHLRNIDNKSE